MHTHPVGLEPIIQDLILRSFIMRGESGKFYLIEL